MAEKIIIVDDKGEEHQFTKISDLVAYANSFQMSWLPDGHTWSIQYDKQEKESIYPRTIQAILDVKEYLQISEVDGWVDLKKQLDELHQKVSDEKEDFENE